MLGLGMAREERLAPLTKRERLLMPLVPLELFRAL